MMNEHVSGQAGGPSAGQGNGQGNIGKRVGKPLIAWAIGNAGIGWAFVMLEPGFWQGLLVQAFFWGVIDGAIGLSAWFGKKEQPLAKLEKIFLVNAWLDAVYMGAGVLVAMVWHVPLGVGTGVGIAIQGAFLLVMDVKHYRAINAVIHVEA